MEETYNIYGDTHELIVSAFSLTDAENQFWKEYPNETIVSVIKCDNELW